MDNKPAAPVARQPAGEGDQPDLQKPFFFRLVAGATGVDELSFQKNGELIFATLLFTCEYINSTFDVPFPTTGDFIQALKEASDKVDELTKAKGGKTPAQIALEQNAQGHSDGDGTPH
jgi:hypothetical protein